MKLPWQKEASESQNPSTLSSISFPEKMTEAQEPHDHQDGERHIIPVPEDEKSSSRTSLDKPQAVEKDVGAPNQVRTTEDKEAETDLVPLASRATEASSAGDDGEDDESKYPRAFPLAILTFGLCLSTFVVALDNTIIGMLQHSPNLFPIVLMMRSNCDPKNHHHLRFPQRCRLVRVILSLDDHVPSTQLWKGVHLFQHKMDIHNRLGHLRDWLHHLCCCRQFDYADHRTRCSWGGSCGAFLWRHDHNWLFCSVAETCHLHRSAVEHVWHFVGGWANSRRSFH